MAIEEDQQPVADLDWFCHFARSLDESTPAADA
jgi:hypothetical protein